MNTLAPMIRNWLEEDDLSRNFFYNKSLPATPVQMTIKLKSDMIFAGAYFFIAVFKELGIEEKTFEELKEYEGKTLKKGTVIVFKNGVPFNVAVTGERLALNLVQHASSIATFTNKFVKLAQARGIKILDTRKTTPGLRLIEKYAVRIGGGFNHRFGQADAWMIKDNHKICLGGLKGAAEFFQSQGTFYNEIIAEIHDLNELKTAKKLSLKRLMLDNFSPEDVKKAILLKDDEMTFEVSGGITLENLKDYLIEGVDAISTSQITTAAPKIDISLKYKPY